jgi:hypothetical protein
MFAFDKVGASSLARPGIWGSMNSMFSGPGSGMQPEAGAPNDAASAPAVSSAPAAPRPSGSVPVPRMQESTMGASLVGEGQREEDGIWGFRTSYVT